MNASVIVLAIKMNRQKRYKNKENFDKWGRKTNQKGSFGTISHFSTCQSIYHWERSVLINM